MQRINKSTLLADFDHYEKQSDLEPITVEDSGRDGLVLISNSEYRMLTTAMQIVIRERMETHRHSLGRLAC